MLFFVLMIIFLFLLFLICQEYSETFMSFDGRETRPCNPLTIAPLDKNLDRSCFQLPSKVSSNANSSNGYAFIPSTDSSRTSYSSWGSTDDWILRSGSSAGKVILQDNGGFVQVGSLEDSFENSKSYQLVVGSPEKSSIVKGPVENGQYFALPKGSILGHTYTNKWNHPGNISVVDSPIRMGNYPSDQISNQKLLVGGNSALKGNVSTSNLNNESVKTREVNINNNKFVLSSLNNENSLKLTCSNNDDVEIYNNGMTRHRFSSNGKAYHNYLNDDFTRTSLTTLEDQITNRKSTLSYYWILSSPANYASPSIGGTYLRNINTEMDPKMMWDNDRGFLLIPHSGLYHLNVIAMFSSDFSASQSLELRKSNYNYTTNTHGNVSTLETFYSSKINYSMALYFSVGNSVYLYTSSSNLPSCNYLEFSGFLYFQ